MKIYQLDDHKLLYHLERLNRWQNGEHIYPLYIAVSPSGWCNLKCIFCAYSYLDGKNVFLKKEVVSRILKEFRGIGVKAVFYSGEGEPFLNKELTDMVIDTYENGIDTAINTNGILFTEDIIREILDKLTFVRYSVNAGTPDTYKKIHLSHDGAFETVIDNITDAVEIKKARDIDTTIGIQCLLLAENINDLIPLAKILREIGVDYLAIKPFLKHPQIDYDTQVSLLTSDANNILTELEALSTDTFKIIIRRNAFERYKGRTYKRCLSLPFMAEIDCLGDVYPCGPYLGHKDFVYGNIYENTFKEIWNSKKCREAMEHMCNRHDVSICMPNCRNDAVNRFLWQIINPPEHVNFI